MSAKKAQPNTLFSYFSKTPPAKNNANHVLSPKKSPNSHTKNPAVQLQSNFVKPKNGDSLPAGTPRPSVIKTKNSKTATPINKVKDEPVNGGTSTAPTARGLNQEFFYKETLRVPTFIVKWSASSDTKKTVLSFNPTSARTRFREVASTLRTSQEMDFETFPRIKITFTFSNDNCQSKYYILIRIGDENDVPVLGPAEQSLKVDEGQVFAQPNYIITDGDFSDRHTFSFFRDRTGGYNIDPFTGAISHPTGVIIDKIRQMEVSFQVVVTDEKNLAESNKILVKLLIQDINNNAPEFMVKSLTRTATACDLPQQLDIKLEFFDSDSSQNGNADISIIPVTSGPLTVTPDGTVYMTTNIKAGESYIVQAFAKDHGTNPGSLTSIVPVTITLIENIISLNQEDRITSIKTYVQPKIQDGFSVDNLHEGEKEIKQLTCITCTCNGDSIAHYVVELVSINSPTYCRKCFSIYNLTNVISGSPPNYCLYYLPGVIPISYRRGPVFDMIIRCTVENTATTPTPTTPPVPNSIPVTVPESSLPECTESTTESTVSGTTDSTSSTTPSTRSSTVTALTSSVTPSTVPCKKPNSATQIPTTSVRDIVTTSTPGTIPPFLTAEGRIQVRVIPNRPPVFNPLAESITKNALGVNDGGIVYTVPVTDPEGDPISFTMSVDPRSTNFYIDGSGNIRAVKTLRSECSATVYTFNVTATDNFHDPVGPHVVTVRLSGTSTAPTARGLNREFFYKETVRVPTFIAKWSVSSDNKRTNCRFNPSSAKTRFNIVSRTIRTSQEMDFETFPRINITFTFSNDHCQSEYYILIRIGNVNDVPKLGPAEQSIKVSEGQVFAQPSYTVTDGDFNDRHTYSFFRDRSSGYNIDPFTGAISHPTGVVIDKIGVTPVSFQVVVTDERGPAESNKVLVKLLIQDINNHAPEFMVKSFTKSATACDLPQDLGIKLEISDQDSSLFGNAYLSIIPVTSGPLDVTHDGTVYMTKAVVPGEIYFVQVYAKDHGTNPGSLTSIVPVTITLIGKPCPTQFPTATPKPTTPAANSGSAVGNTGASGGSISINQNINSNTNNNAGGANSGASASASASATTDETTDAAAAIVLGTLLGLLLLVGLLYLLYRFCLPRFFPDAHYNISNAFSNCSERCCPRNYNATEPIRGGQGRNTDFWKEGTKNNRNYKTTNNYYTRPLPYQYDSKY